MSAAFAKKRARLMDDVYQTDRSIEGESGRQARSSLVHILRKKVPAELSKYFDGSLNDLKIMISLDSDRFFLLVIS